MEQQPLRRCACDTAAVQAHPAQMHEATFLPVQSRYGGPGLCRILDSFRRVLQEGTLEQRTRFLVEGMFLKVHFLSCICVLGPTSAALLPRCHYHAQRQLGQTQSNVIWNTASHVHIL